MKFRPKTLKISKVLYTMYIRSNVFPQIIEIIEFIVWPMAELTVFFLYLFLYLIGFVYVFVFLFVFVFVFVFVNLYCISYLIYRPARGGTDKAQAGLT